MARKIIEWGTDESFIENYMELKSSRKMGELYNCDKTSVLNHAKKLVLILIILIENINYPQKISKKL